MPEIYLDKSQRDALRKRAADSNNNTSMNYAVLALADTCDALEQSARDGEEAYHKQRERAEQAEAERDYLRGVLEQIANGEMFGPAAQAAQERDECEQGSDAQAQFAAKWLARLSAERDRLRAALERISSHDGARWDWTDEGPHRKDSPQEIAQQALEAKEAR